MEDMELICLQIISNAGEARSESMEMCIRDRP